MLTLLFINRLSWEKSKSSKCLTENYLSCSSLVMFPASVLTNIFTNHDDLNLWSTNYCDVLEISKKPIKSCNLNLPLKFFLIYSNCQTFWSWGDKIMTFNGQFVDTSIIDTKTLFIATLRIIGEIITLSWTLLYSFLLSCPPVAKTIKLFGRILHFCAQIVSVFDSAKYFHVFLIFVIKSQGH